MPLAHRNALRAALPLAALRLAERQLALQSIAPPPTDVVEWIEKYFYIEETEKPIKLLPHQKAILRYALQRNAEGNLKFQTVIYSTIKKSGKTALAGAVARYVAESWGKFSDVYFLGNDVDQAKDRGFKALLRSVELTPGFNQGKRELPGEWTLLDASAAHLPTGSRLKAIATDYQGEAGANPVLTVWTELWAFVNKAAVRFWAEMAPSPTRKNSLRWVETYAGFEGESELLYALYEGTVKNGRQLTAGEMNCAGAFKEAPNPEDKIPCYINEAAGIFAYWDEGIPARRMPWQLGENGARYYANEAATQTPAQMERLHGNSWVSAESSFVDIAQWDQCKEVLPLKPGDRTPLVVALDAGVSGDCFGAVATSRHPDPKRSKDAVAVRLVKKWDPPPGGNIDFSGPEEWLKQVCKDYNVVEVAYDPYQLVDFARRLTQAGVAWFRPFNQGDERLKADKQLYDLVTQKRIAHDGNLDLREHITNANAKVSTNDESKLRIVKKSDSRKIDLVVSLSMSAAECLRLNL